MKTSIKIALLVLAAMLAIAAARSGKSQERLTKYNCYSDEEVQLLVKENGWTQEQAIKVLEWSCENPITPE